jgi:hypothetical protein
VVTENVTQTVSVSHEEVRVERRPITDANRDAALSGPAITEEEQKVVLNAERPVVEKKIVPAEQVRFATDTVTEQSFAACTQAVTTSAVAPVSLASARAASAADRRTRAAAPPASTSRVPST